MNWEKDGRTARSGPTGAGEDRSSVRSTIRDSTTNGVTVQSETATVNMAAPTVPRAGRRLSRRGVVALIVTAVCLAVLGATVALTSGGRGRGGGSQAGSAPVTAAATATDRPTGAGTPSGPDATPPVQDGPQNPPTAGTSNGAVGGNGGNGGAAAGGAGNGGQGGGGNGTGGTSKAGGVGSAGGATGGSGTGGGSAGGGSAAGGGGASGGSGAGAANGGAGAGGGGTQVVPLPAPPPAQSAPPAPATSRPATPAPSPVATPTPPPTGWTGGYRTVIPQGTAVDLGNPNSPAVSKWDGPNETFGWYGKADDGSELAGYKDAAAFLPSDAPATRDACLAATNRFASGYAPHGFAPGDRVCVFTSKNSNALITVVANTAVARQFDGQLTVDVLYGPAGL